MWEAFLQALSATLAIVSPWEGVPIFLDVTRGMDASGRARAARTTAVAVLVILLASAFAGRWILLAFGLTLPALRAGGGLVILLMGVEMIRGLQTRVQHPAPLETSEDAQDGLYVPLAMPMLAGPGAITTVITLAADLDRHAAGWLVLAGAIAVVALVSFIVLRFAVKIGAWLNARAQRIVLRFMGLLLVSLGTEFLLSGARQFFRSG